MRGIQLVFNVKKLIAALLPSLYDRGVLKVREREMFTDYTQCHEPKKNYFDFSRRGFGTLTAE
jgi:hypothetical protein